MTDRQSGEVVSFDAEKGYGRIKDSEDREYFVHFRDIIAGVSLQPGQPVRFKGRLHRKGNIASEVELA